MSNIQPPNPTPSHDPTPTQTIAQALLNLAWQIKAPDDVPATALRQAAARLLELEAESEKKEDWIAELTERLERKQYDGPYN